MIKKVLLVVVILGVLGGSYGYYLWNKKAPSTASRDSELTITAVELATQYDNAKHLGKVLQVKGKVAGVASENGATNITLETDDPMVSVSCEMESNTATPSVKEGDEVTIKGQCDGKLTDIVLTRCIVTQ